MCAGADSTPISDLASLLQGSLAPKLVGTMPKKKIDLQKVLSSINTTCPTCTYEIPAPELRRIDFDHVLCPKCGERFVPAAYRR